MIQTDPARIARASLRDDITERDGRIRALQDLVAEGAQRNAETLPAISETDRLIAELQSRASRLAACRCRAPP